MYVEHRGQEEKKKSRAFVRRLGKLEAREGLRVRRKEEEEENSLASNFTSGFPRLAAS